MARSSETEVLPPAAPNVRGHLPALDGVRGLAILAVMAFHHLDDSSGDAVTAAISRATSIGWAGVDLFFVLSGFLITGILADTRDDARCFRNFYARRTLRIFPLYYAVVAVVLLAGRFLDGSFPFMRGTWDPQGWLWGYGVNVKLAIDGSMAGFTSRTAWMSHFWSLAIEEQFYVLWPLAVVMLPPRRARTVAWTLVGVALAARCAMLAGGASPVAVYVLPFCRMDALCLGAALALALRDDAVAATTARRIQVAGAVAACVVVPGLLWFGRGSDAHPAVQSAGFTLIAIACAGLVVHAVAARAGSFAGRVLRHPALTTPGRYAYGLYVFHFLPKPLFDRWAGIDEIGRAVGVRWVALLLHAGVAFGVSWLLARASYHAFEIRFLRMKDRFAPQSVAVPSAAPAAATVAAPTEPQTPAPV